MLNHKIVAAIGALGLIAQGATAATRSFSFWDAEFAPRDQREAMARDYVAHTMGAGVPISDAVAAANRAGARCGRPDEAGVVVCTESSMQHASGEDLTDIIWKVRISTSKDGRVALASVTREKSGF